MSKKWISFPRVEGTASRQAHTDLPEGTYEREMSKEGFFGPSAQFHHRHPPTGWSDWEGPLKPRAFDLTKLNSAANSPWDAVDVLHNQHCRIRLWRADGDMRDLARNGDGDELMFVHEGAGHLYCDFGHLAIREGDYVMIPRGTQWRIECAQPVTALLVEATNDSYRLPDKGLVGNHAIFDAAMLDTPRLDDAFKAQQQGVKGSREWKVRIKRRGAISTVTYPYNPLDVVGWHGDLAPVRINWRDIRPIMSHRYHLPPSAHTTFIAGRFVVCTFCPRPIESDPGALKVPFFHNNDDYDEMIFYHRGSFFSRDNIHPGMVTLHPCGFPHGPHPKAFATGAKAARKETDEVAVMVDTHDALDTGPLPEGVEWPGYVKSWQTKPQAAE
ncbi:MAG: homogentisate 1,2-dioxygenase [Alphaproteobacteria bacterium]|nr:homogentisate 1,2-dioxygenase [Alphaproteobacteria bacterium]